MSRRRGAPRTAKAPGTPPARAGRRGLENGWLAAGAIFCLALALRLLFGRSTPDASWAYSAAFKGDALVWLEYARALRLGQPFELGLPLRPPGNAYLVSWLWDGSAAGIAFLRTCWAALGALAPLLTYVAVRRSFGARAALFAGLWAAASTGLIVLANTLDSETPYLVFALASLALFEDLKRPHPLTLGVWASLQGLACLLRVEHALFSLLMLALLGALWRREESSRTWIRTVSGRCALALAVFAVVVLPWHVRAWRAIERFNRDVPAASSAEASVERRLAGLSWESAATARRDALPGFARRTAALFVAATVAHRGGSVVRAEDFRILGEAFAYEPSPLASRPFVALYGPLNFALANHAGATGGFSLERLDRRPPLFAHPERFPPELIAGLPPPQLALPYPPHLALVNDGYAQGLGWIADAPGDFLRLALRKLLRFWSGAAMGFGGWNAPLGLSGVRRAVDFVTPADSVFVTAWRLMLLIAACAGLCIGRREPALGMWALYLATKVVAVVAFFGYARQGALCVPVIALLVALAVARASERSPSPRFTIAVAVLTALALAAESARLSVRPGVAVDGVVIGPADTSPRDLHQDQRFEVNLRRR